MEKRFKNGLVLGKFMPPQKGHLHLIDTAAEQCETLHVVIDSTSNQPIKGSLRFKWLQKIYKKSPNIKVIHSFSNNPQYPQECDSVDTFYNKYWVPTIYKLIPNLDVVFTSEEYGEEFGRYLGVPHVLVDQARSTYAVSGTAVRNNPIKNWNFIPDVVKPFYTKKIVIMGTESCGKSTLVKNLTKHFGSKCFVEEYGRTYTEKNGTTNLAQHDFEVIAEKHNELIKRRLNQNKSKFLFIDTEAIITKTFGEMYLGDDFKSPMIDYFINEQKFDLYILLTTDVPWVDDGTRDFPEDRMKHYNKIVRELQKRKIDYVLIGGNYEERFEKSKAEINKLTYL